MEKIMVIDGSSLIHRAFYALPLLTTKKGLYTNGVYGFLTMLNKVTDEYSPDYICVAFDRKGPTLRHKEYDQYKGTRQSTPSELAQQFPLMREILQNMNITSVDMSEYEADDIAGTLARIGEKEGMEVILVTGDKDYLQLATENTKVVITKKGISEIEIYDRNRIVEEYEIEPLQFIQLKALMGDKSDNIPGVPGIGEKTGLKLIKEYGNLENLYKNIDNVSGKKLKENLTENENMAYLSRRLGEIITTVPLPFELEDLKAKTPDWKELKEIYEELEFKSLLSRLPDEYRENANVEIKYDYNEINTDGFQGLKERIRKNGEFAFKFIIDGSNYVESPIIGIGIKTGNDPTDYISLINSKDEFISSFKEIFEDTSIEKSGYNIKSDIVLLFRLGINIKNYVFDSLIAQYLINPSQSNYSINKIGEEHLGIYGIDEESLLGKGKGAKTYGSLDKEELMKYVSFILEMTSNLKPVMMKIIEEQGMEKLYREVELPLSEVLSSMEFYGFEIDEDELNRLGEEYNREINSTTNEIYDLAGMEFNINSPKQIGDVLFEKLMLPVIKKTKTGYSTDVEVLDKLKDEHPIVEKILRYRHIVKLNSTYIEGLLNLINRDTGRIHSTFNQTIATTGRISSTDPNLQNIPIRTEDGRKIRKAFISDKPNYKLVDGDYSQIELRILAHISQDEKMMEAFVEGIDIHTKTASEVFHVPLDEVTAQLRYRAKAVNFGIVYGISDYGLSRDLDITRKEAKEYIDNYFSNFSRVRKYMDEIVDEGRENGYVETILNRRRYVPELNAKNFNVRSFGERIALNTPIQGSAADIIKKAMVEVYNEINNRKLKSKLVLTIHDELIIEAHNEEIDEVVDMMKSVMENAIALTVPLRVDIEVGDSWYDTK